jgi:hypothetical protein
MRFSCRHREPTATWAETRDTLIGPGVAELDLSVLNPTGVSEKNETPFRAEFFNLLNRTNFSTPNTIVFSSASRPRRPRRA